MPGGSLDPDDHDAERQCKHCGRWFHRGGLSGHEAVCDYRGVAHRIVDLTDPLALARIDEDDDDGAGGDAPGVDDVEEADPVDDPVGEGSADPDPQGSDVADGSADAARTDGGPSAVPEFDADVVADGGVEEVDVDNADDDGPTCPTCGSANVEPVDSLPSGILRAAPGLASRAWLCVPCSTSGEVDGDVGQADLRVEERGGRSSVVVEAFAGDRDD